MGWSLTATEGSREMCNICSRQELEKAALGGPAGHPLLEAESANVTDRWKRTQNVAEEDQCSAEGMA